MSGVRSGRWRLGHVHVGQRPSADVDSRDRAKSGLELGSFPLSGPHGIWKRKNEKASLDIEENVVIESGRCTYLHCNCLRRTACMSNRVSASALFRDFKTFFFHNEENIIIPHFLAVSIFHRNLVRFFHYSCKTIYILWKFWHPFMVIQWLYWHRTAQLKMNLATLQ